eukprot:GILJ01006059.1.p1 GENE.GILJ01006059.1~~GILJ01006059.1.p1  ORF type:complete len:491 (-),score=54.93 GILJ01006059.1:76-1548(-)
MDSMTSSFGDPDDHPHEYCGVFGIYAPGSDVARLSAFAMSSLQHRGQESAGLATSDGFKFHVHKGMGLVNQIFNDQNTSQLKGHVGIGHTRYSTTGSSEIANAQPFIIETYHGPLALAHNGNLTQANTLRQKTLKQGVGLFSSSDSEIITQMLCQPPPDADESNGPDWIARIRRFMAEAEGAFSLVLMTRDALYGVRDCLGMRPLCIGEMDSAAGPNRSYVISSESCALMTIGADYLREVAPGEIVRIDQHGLASFVGRESIKKAFCIFEYVYFARPDSVFEGQLIHATRRNMGKELAREAPVQADFVMSVPDSGTPAAIGYAEASGIPYGEGLTKNRYIARTFIQPDQRLRNIGVRLKFNPLPQALKDKSIVVIDDSIVRGTTMRQMVTLLRDGGAREIHIRVSSPPVQSPCFMGVDMATVDQLVYCQQHKSIEGVRQYIGADSLAYLTHEGMLRAVAGARAEETQSADELGYCSACFTGSYPLAVDDW